MKTGDVDAAGDHLITIVPEGEEPTCKGLNKSRITYDYDQSALCELTEERIIDNTACIPEVFGSKLNINCIHSFWILFGMGAKSD